MKVANILSTRKLFKFFIFSKLPTFLSKFIYLRHEKMRENDVSIAFIKQPVVFKCLNEVIQRKKKHWNGKRLAQLLWTRLFQLNCINAKTVSESMLRTSSWTMYIFGRIERGKRKKYQTESKDNFTRTDFCARVYRLDTIII